MPMHTFIIYTKANKIDRFFLDFLPFKKLFILELFSKKTTHFKEIKFSLEKNKYLFYGKYQFSLERTSETKF